MADEKELTITGVISGVSRKWSGTKAVFFLQLSGRSAREFNRGEIKCSCFRSWIHLYMPSEVKGTFNSDNIFMVSSIKPVFSNTSQVSDYMAYKVKGSGVGRKRAEEIVKRYGEKVFSMGFQEFHDTLVENFPRISVRTVDAFLTRWFHEDPVSALEEYLSQYDVKYQTITAIDAEYGEDALDMIKTDPYSICLYFDLERDLAEEIAYNEGISSLGHTRITGLISFALKAASRQGHTYMDAPLLAKRVNRYSAKSIYKTRIPAIYIANTVALERRFILDRHKKAVAFRGLYNDEINTALKLKSINSNVRKKMSITDAAINKAEKQLKIHLAPEQRKALSLLSDKGIGILTGGPGTGKTTIVRGIISCFLNEFPEGRIKLIAPTGRAARKLSEATGLCAETIHRAIGLAPFGDGTPEYNPSNPLDADLVIMDETSMCDAHILNLLLNAIPLGSRILFIGDEDQLPSVGAGNCLHDMIASGRFPVCRLTENFRSEDSITENAKLVLSGQKPKEADDFKVIAADNEKQAFSILTELMDEFYDKKDPFKCQMIEPSVKGEAGARAINAYVHKNVIHKALGSNVSNEIMTGDKIMFIRNEYCGTVNDGNGPLYVNGEIGIVKSLLDDTVIIWDGYEDKVLSVSALDDAVFSYSCTIHKSQGSESDIVIICLPDSVKSMMNRNLLYTAITRAKKKVIIVYTGTAFEDCINNVYHIKRNTRLKERLVLGN